MHNFDTFSTDMAQNENMSTGFIGLSRISLKSKDTSFASSSSKRSAEKEIPLNDPENPYNNIESVISKAKTYARPIMKKNKSREKANANQE